MVDINTMATLDYRHGGHKQYSCDIITDIVEINNIDAMDY